MYVCLLFKAALTKNTDTSCDVNYKFDFFIDIDK